MRRCSAWVVACLSVLLLARAAETGAKGKSLSAPPRAERRNFVLAAEARWSLEASRRERFDASGLVLRDGKLLTINDRGPELYEIELGTNGTARLNPSGLFSRRALALAAPGKAQRFDGEGIALDAAGRIYLCEESQRAVWRANRDGSVIELLEIDWSPAARYFGVDRNASFEGIALGAGRLYVANERERARIIVVELASLKVTGTFAPDSSAFALGGPHYSDLAFFGGRLFVLDRNHRAILEVDPETGRVAAEHSFAAMETAADTAYQTSYPTGCMEGLAIDENHFWLVTDNNGQSRKTTPGDTRPTLFKARRPGR